MKIAVQLFAQLRAEAGESELMLELPEESTVRAALAAAYAARPALTKWDGCLLTAIGVEYVVRDHALADGETLLLFPPVQGG